MHWEKKSSSLCQLEALLIFSTWGFAYLISLYYYCHSPSYLWDSGCVHIHTVVSESCHEPELQQVLQRKLVWELLHIPEKEVLNLPSLLFFLHKNSYQALEQVAQEVVNSPRGILRTCRCDTGGHGLEVGLAMLALLLNLIIQSFPTLMIL